MTDLELIIDPEAMPMLLPLLQKGVGLPVQIGCTIRQFLCDQLGISDTYLDQRIQTLFLNARPVDDVDGATLQDGATLALSAAMPGLLGATMRKGGHYAAFRQSISLAASMPSSHETGKGRVTVKLFNMVAEEAGPGLLEKGVWINGRQVRRLGEFHPDIWPRIREARLDGQPFDPRQAFTHVGGKDQPIRLTVHLDQPTTASRPHF